MRIKKFEGINLTSGLLDFENLPRRLGDVFQTQKVLRDPRLSRIPSNSFILPLSSRITSNTVINSYIPPVNPLHDPATSQIFCSSIPFSYMSAGRRESVRNMFFLTTNKLYLRLESSEKLNF